MTAKSKRQGYFCHIQNLSSGVDIVADLPEAYQQAVGAQYEARNTAFGLDGGDGLSGAIAAWINPSIMMRSLTAAVWRGSSPVQFSLQLLFDAEENTYDDVQNNLVMLQTLTLPYDNGGDILYPPNPSTAIAWASMNLITRQSLNPGMSEITVRIGKQWYFPSCVVMSAAMSSDTRLNEDLPIAGSINLEVTTSHVYTKADLMRAASMGRNVTES